MLLARRPARTEDPLTPAARILLVEADPIARNFLTDNLTADGYDVVPVGSDHAAIAELTDGCLDVDLLLVDVNDHTLQLLDAIRDEAAPLGDTPTDLPAVVLTSHTEPLHHVRLLERGADDVIAKPFSYTEVRARIAAVLRRTVPRHPRPMIVAGDLRVDLHHRHVSIAGQPVHVSDTEYRLLCALGAEPTRVFTRSELLAAIWGASCPTSTRTLDSHAHRLRRKLAAASHPLIINIWGVGLQLMPTGGPA